MVNRLPYDIVHAIWQLKKQGLSIRKIASTLQIAPNTVQRYIREIKERLRAPDTA